jgi:1-pyrroline-5-carboxylate dehydrogenase
MLRVRATTSISSSLRHFSSNARFVLPAFEGEAFRHYAPGSPEAVSLKAACERVRSQVVEIPCVVNGKEIFTGDVAEQVIPSDHGHVIARYHQATPEVVQEAIAVSNSARKEWENTPFEHRAAVFKKAADLIAGPEASRVMAATMLGTGKTPWQAEIDSRVESVDFLRLNNKFAEEIYTAQPPLNSRNTWNRMRYRGMEGFVLAISPFNFCAIGANLCASPALMGNTVLWKPAPTAVLSNYEIFKIFQESGLPDGVISFLPGDGPVVGEAINHEDFGGLHFTGSTQVFNKLWQQVGNNLGNYKSYPRIVGETGGKNFHLLHKSADLEHAVNNTVRGAFEYQGQKCSACSRMYVPKSMWPEVKQRLQERVSEIKIGQPDDFENFMTAVIDAKAFNVHKGFIDRAHASPEAEIIAGGTYDDSKGYFVNPTIIVTSNPHYESMEKEIFGPVLTVFVYEDSEWDDTLKLVDTTSPYGLTGAIFARERTAIVQAEEALKFTAGNFYINDKSTGAVVGEQPFGGARASGTNDKAGSHLNLLRWTQAQTIKETMVPLREIGYPHME